MSSRGTKKCAWGEIHRSWPDLSDPDSPCRYFHTDFIVGQEELDIMDDARSSIEGLVAIQPVEDTPQAFRLIFAATAVEQMNSLTNAFLEKLQQKLDMDTTPVIAEPETPARTRCTQEEIAAAMACYSEVGAFHSYKD